jgi:hypothetical protein
MGGEYLKGRKKISYYRESSGLDDVCGAIPKRLERSPDGVFKKI